MLFLYNNYYLHFSYNLIWLIPVIVPSIAPVGGLPDASMTFNIKKKKKNEIMYIIITTLKTK